MRIGLVVMKYLTLGTGITIQFGIAHSRTTWSRNRVRQRLMKLYEDLKTGRRPLDRKTARVLYMTFEHEAFHAEVGIHID